MFKFTLFGKIFILIFFTMIVIFVFFTYLFIFSQKDAIVNNQVVKAKSIVQNIVVSNSDAMIVEDEISLLESIQNLVLLNDEIKSIEITRYLGNKIIVGKDSWDLIDKEKVQKETFPEKAKFEIVFSKIVNAELFSYTFPVVFTEVLWGKLNLKLDLTNYNNQITKLSTNAVLLAVILIFISFLISYFLAKMIVKPIVELNDITKDIINGNLTKRVKVNSNDEIGHLANSFNKMVYSLSKSQRKLKESHSKLEERVEQRTKELNELNENLEKRVLEEIKKRQDNEQLLIQQSKLASMGEMIGNIAHQWRQPLNALSLVMQNIQFAYELEELNDEFMEKSVKKVNLLANNMSKTIDDFRNFFKPNKERSLFNLGEIVDNTFEIIESSFDYNKIVINKKIEKDIKVFGFANEFSQTILNILNNAKDALIENKVIDAKVSITVRKSDDDYGEIIIEDNAGGIKSDVIKKIFEPYFTTKEEGKGTGIGLYMSKIIIEQNMNGKLYVKNIENGARFTVKVPLNEV